MGSALSDATPLIFLAKIKKLDLLQELFGKIYISPEVYNEAVEVGKEKRAPDAIAIEEAIKQNWIQVKKLTGKSLKSAQHLVTVTGLHKGEASILALAKQLGEKLILVDEEEARKISKIWGLRPLGTLGILIFAYKQKILTRNEIEKAIQEMSKFGFYMNLELYQKVLSETKT